MGLPEPLLSHGPASSLTRGCHQDLDNKASILQSSPLRNTATRGNTGVSLRFDQRL